MFELIYVGLMLFGGMILLPALYELGLWLHRRRFLQKLRAYPHLQTLGGVVEHPWGQRVIRFYDLDGHLIEVGESMKLVTRRFQAAGMTPEEQNAFRRLLEKAAQNLT